ncbi:MAG: DUF3090 family protein [Dehalococcoidia bacterium]
MANTPRDFGPVIRLDVVSEGQPGRRTFHLYIINPDDVVVFPIEKEQLQALGLAIEQLLAQVDEPAGEGLVPAGPEPVHETHERPIGRLGLGFDETSDLFVIVVYFGATDEAGPPDVVCRANRITMKGLSAKIDEIVASGRPRCPLCGVAMNPDGHTCIRSNGHFKTG